MQRALNNIIMSEDMLGIQFEICASNNIPRFTHRKTAAMRPLPIERALKTDILTVSAAYQQ